MPARGYLAIACTIAGVLLIPNYRRVGEALDRWFEGIGPVLPRMPPGDRIPGWRLSGAGVGIALSIIGIVDLVRVL